MDKKQARELKRRDKRERERLLTGKYAMSRRGKKKVKLPPWQRDGFKTELHYLVHHKKPAMQEALRRLAPSVGISFEDHPMAKLALEAKEKGLI